MPSKQYRVWEQRTPIVIGRSAEGNNEYGANIVSAGVVEARSAAEAIARAKDKGLAKDPIVRRINGS